MGKKETSKYNCDLIKEMLLNPYTFKSGYEWNGVEAEEWRFCDKYYTVDSIIEDKYLELTRIIVKYVWRWNHLPGQISGKLANWNVFLSHYGIPWHWDNLRRILNIDESKYPDLQKREEMVGCAYATEETYLALIDTAYKYWNIALIEIWGHQANVVYDNEIGQKETYVLDPWPTQRPDVYKWNDWTFYSKDKCRVEYEHKKTTRITISK